MMASMRSSLRAPRPSVKSGTMTSSRPTSCHAATASATSSVVPAIGGPAAALGEERVGLGLVVGEEDQRLGGPLDLAGSRPIASQRWSSTAARSAIVVGQAPHVPLVGVAGDDAHHAVALAADEQRQRRLDGLGSQMASVSW